MYGSKPPPGGGEGGVPGPFTLHSNLKKREENRGLMDKSGAPFFFEVMHSSLKNAILVIGIFVLKRHETGSSGIQCEFVVLCPIVIRQDPVSVFNSLQQQ